jgi:hypothetical protein
MAPGVPSRSGRIKGRGRRWPPPWFQKGENIAGFIERRHRIVVARQHHQLTAGLLQAERQSGYTARGRSSAASRYQKYRRRQ